MCFFFVRLYCMNIVMKKKHALFAKNFSLIYSVFRTDHENQFYEYTLTIYNVTFEDETEIKISAKSSALEKSKIIKPNVIGNPVGQFSFVPNQIPRIIPWRDEDYKNKLNIYAYGIYERESYRVVCTIRHRADIDQSLNVFIQHTECSVDNCLSDIIDKTCQSPGSQRLPITKANRINNFQTQFISIESQVVDDPSIGHQYICCYEQNGLIILAKALTALARKIEKFQDFIYFFYLKEIVICLLYRNQNLV